MFSVNKDGSAYTVVKDFNGPDGAHPRGRLLLSNNVLYGTTVRGGSRREGTVFRVNTDGTGFSLLSSFGDGVGGSRPHSGLLLDGTRLYGAAHGWGNGDGVVYGLNTDGTDHRVLLAFFHFAPYIGGVPIGDMVLSNGRLFGTSGMRERSRVFTVTTEGTGFTNVVNFTDTDAYLQAGVALDGDTLYGASETGGPHALRNDERRGQQRRDCVSHQHGWHRAHSAQTICMGGRRSSHR